MVESFEERPSGMEESAEHAYICLSISHLYKYEYVHRYRYKYITKYIDLTRFPFHSSRHTTLKVALAVGS